MTTPSSATDEPTPPRPPSRRQRAAAASAAAARRLWRLALGLSAAVLVLLLFLVVAGLGTWQFARSEAGARWALQQVPGLQFSGLQGSPLQDRLRIERLRWAGTDQQPVIEIDGLLLQNPRWSWRPHPGAWIGLNADAAQAQAVRVQSPRSPSGAPEPPANLRLPVQVDIAQLRVERLQIDSLAPLHALQARLALGQDQGRRHQLTQLQLQTDQVRVDGDLGIGADAPLPLQATLALGSRQSPPWQASVRAEGPLAQPQVQATLRGQGPAGGAVSLDAQATVQPFAAWPLPALALNSQNLDLAALFGGAPRTRLSLQARVQSQGLDRPALVDLQARNQAPGRWDQGALPLATLALQARTTPADPQRVDLLVLKAQAADAQGAAGEVSAQGEWTAQALRLVGEVKALQPARLDARAPALEASGPLQATLRGLPGPAALQASARLAPSLGVELDTTLAGRLLQGPNQRLQLKLQGQARWQDGRLQQAEVAELQLNAGDAQAQAQLRASRTAGDRWQLAGQGRLDRLDPRPWWPQAPAARLGGQWRLDLDAPAQWPAAGRATLAAWLQAGRGDASLTLADSQLAGLPLEGQLTLQGDGQRARLVARLASQDNQLGLDADLQREPDADRWQLQVQAPRLAALAPWLRLLPGQAATPWPERGDLALQAQVQGRWPLLRSSGQARLAGLKLADLSLAEAKASWTAGSGTQAPLNVTLQAQDLRRGAQRADRLEASLQGSLAQHQLALSLSSPVRPPAWAESLLGTATLGSRAQLAGSGQWLPEATGGGQWRGRVAELSLAAQLPAGAPATASRPWLALREVDASVEFDGRGEPQRASLAPGRAQLPAGAALRWTQAQWQRGAAGGPDRLDLVAELEALAVAPLLAQAQPELGWAGDLAVGAKLELHAQQQLAADIVFERLRGDLRVTDELGTVQALGLSDLRLGLVVRDGVWQFTQGVAGSLVGEMAGAQVMRTGAQQRWPSPETPLDGVLEMRVANLAAWGTWVPPGWRLGGSLRVSAGLGGRFGAPELSGQMQGRELSLRNPLLGVGLADGELQASLQGAQVRVDSFSFRGGDGRLVLSGGGQLGATPSANLQLQAQHFRVLGRLDRRLVASGQARLQLDAQRLTLDGRVVVDEGLFDFSRADAPTLDDDVVVRRQAGGNGNGKPVADAGPAARGNGPLPAALRNAQVDLRVDLGPALRLRGRGLDTLLRGDLQLSSPGGRLAVNGRVRASDGSYVAYGQKMEIERGDVIFSGPVDNARLDIRAVRPNLDVVVGVAVTGTTQNPRVRLFSEPELSDLDKLSWLVLGRAADGLGRTDTALLQRAAVALLAGEGEAPTDQLLQTLGLTDFSLRQTEGDVRETVVSLGRQLGRRWYVGYERSVNATTGTWQLIYRVAQRFTLRAQSGQENSLDLIWSWRW